MRKALATYGTGPAEELLALSLQSFSSYAERHRYDLVVGDGDSYGRAPSWGKVPLLQRLLTTHDFVVWIDADALILDASVDLEEVVPASAFQAYAVTQMVPATGASPCMGVWALRAGQPAQDFLAAVWEQDEFINHPWEQAAVRRLTGWSNEPPRAKTHASEWD